MTWAKRIPTFYRMPAELFDILPRKCSGKAALACVTQVFRQRVAPGGQRWVKVDWLALAARNNLTPRAIQMGRDEALEQGLLLRQPSGHGGMVYTTVPETWASAHDWPPPGKRRSEDEPDPTDPAESEPAEVPKPISVPPGKAGRVVTLRWPGSTEPLRIRPRNKCAVGVDLLFAVEPDKTISLDVTLSLAGKPKIEASPGEEKAKTSEAQFRSDEITPLESTNLQAGGQTLQAGGQRFAEYRHYFAPVFENELKKPPRVADISHLLTLSQGAPASDFDGHLRKLRRKGIISFGLLLKVAREDVGPAFRARQTAETAAKSGRYDRAAADAAETQASPAYQAELRELEKREAASERSAPPAGKKARHA